MKSKKHMQINHNKKVKLKLEIKQKRKAVTAQNMQDK